MAVTASSGQMSMPDAQDAFNEGAAQPGKPEPTMEEFMAAARKGDADALKSMIALKPQLALLQDGVGDTALMETVRGPHYAAAKVILEAAEVANLPNNLKIYPLALAVTNRDLKMVTLLLEHKANPDTPSDFDFTALMIAAEGGMEEIGAKLLEHKARTDLPDAGGDTAAKIAVMNGHHGFLKLLKKHNAHLNVRDKKGDSLLDHVIHVKRDDKMFDTLVDLGVDFISGNRESTDPLISNTTPAMWAAAANNTYALKKLKQLGAPVDNWNGNGMTPLIFSAINGSGDAAQLLVDWEVPLESPNPRSHSPRNHAVLKEHFNVVNIIDNATGNRIGKTVATLKLGGGNGIHAPERATFRKKGLAP